MSLVKQDFRRNVLGGPAKGVCLEGHTLCEAKICNLQVAFLVKEKVFGLEIAVNEILEGLNKVRN